MSPAELLTVVERGGILDSHVQRRLPELLDPLRTLLRHEWSMEVVFEACRADGRQLYAPLADDVEAVWRYFDATAQQLWSSLSEEAQQRIGVRP